MAPGFQNFNHYVPRVGLTKAHDFCCDWIFHLVFFCGGAGQTQKSICTSFYSAYKGDSIFVSNSNIYLFAHVIFNLLQGRFAQKYIVPLYYLTPRSDLLSFIEMNSSATFPKSNFFVLSLREVANQDGWLPPVALNRRVAIHPCHPL